MLKICDHNKDTRTKAQNTLKVFWILFEAIINFLTQGKKYKWDIVAKTKQKIQMDSIDWTALEGIAK